METDRKVPSPEDNHMKWLVRFRRLPVLALLFLVFNFFIYFLLIFLLDHTSLTDIPVIEKILEPVWVVNFFVTIFWAMLTPVIVIICCISGFIQYSFLVRQHAFADRDAKIKAILPFVCYLILSLLLFAVASAVLSGITEM